MAFMLIYSRLKGWKKGHRRHYEGSFLLSTVSYIILYPTTRTKESSGCGRQFFLFFAPKWVYLYLSMRCVCVFSSGILSLFPLCHPMECHRSCPFTSHFLIPMLLTTREDALWRFSFSPFEYYQPIGWVVDERRLVRQRPLLCSGAAGSVSSMFKESTPACTSYATNTTLLF